MSERHTRQGRQLRQHRDRDCERDQRMINHSTVSPKWTKKQDQKLRQAVLKYGTQWSLISKKYRFQRSVNSLVKRWHGKLKQQVQKGVVQQSKSEQSESEKAQVIQPSKKTKKQQKKQQKRQSRQNPQAKIQSSVHEQEQSENSNESSGESSGSNDEDESQISSVYESKQAAQYVFEHNWKQSDDSLLKDYIINEKILDWEELCTKLKVNSSRDIRRRWQKIIYPSIVESRKIGGCVKYSEEEDTILNRGVKLGLSIQQLRKFLPSRTLYSLDARRRRTLRIDQEETPELRYWIKKIKAYKFVEKRHEYQEKPASQDSYVYRSESQ